LRVLHVSDDPLPDARVEKMAYLSKKMGCETFFAGPLRDGFALPERVFDEMHFVRWNRYVRLGLPPHYQWVRRRLQKAIRSVRPDIIHAHNVFSARMVHDLGYPFVYDDHELVSMEKLSDVAQGVLYDRAVGKYEAWLWSRWEHQLSSRAPVITVSDGIARFYARWGASVFTVPNFPSLVEVSRAHLSEEKSNLFSVVYLGDDITASHKPYRDVRGIVDIFRGTDLRLAVIGDRNLRSEGPVLSRGYIEHSNLYDVISGYHVGLLPWKKHWFHRYANPNKPYIYAHSGVVVVATSSLQNVVEAFEGRARTIENFTDLKELLLELSRDVEGTIREGEDTRTYALNNLLFEHYESNVIEAYKKAT